MSDSILGTTDGRPPWLQYLYAFCVIVGTLFILSTSLYVLGTLLLRNRRPAHIFARFILVCLGVLVLLWLDSAIGMAGQSGLVLGFRSLLLSPAPSTFVGQVITVAVSTCVSLIFVHACFKWLDTVRNRYAIAGLTFFWSSYVTLFLLLSLALLNTQDVARYTMFPVSVGCICGYGIRLVYRLLKNEETLLKGMQS